MSATILIKPEKKTGKKLTIKDVLPEELSWGISDAYGRLEEGKEGEYTIVFDPENIGRGFQIKLDGTTTEIHLNYFNSRHDIELCYMMVERICRLQGIDTFIHEDETVRLDRIEPTIQREIEVCADSLSIAAEKVSQENTETLTVFAVVHPLYIGKKEIALFGSDIDKYSEWLNEKQQIDVYYGVPHFYEKDDGSTFGVYALRADVASVMPVKPSMPINMKDQFEVSNWYVMLGYSDDSDSGKSDGLKVIDYSGLAKHIQNGEYYDANHVIVRLTDSDVDALLKEHRVTL